MLLRLEFAKGHIGDVWIRLTEAIGFIRAQRQRAADSDDWPVRSIPNRRIEQTRFTRSSSAGRWAKPYGGIGCSTQS